MAYPFKTEEENASVIFILIYKLRWLVGVIPFKTMFLLGIKFPYWLVSEHCTWSKIKLVWNPGASLILHSFVTLKRLNFLGSQFFVNKDYCHISIFGKNKSIENAWLFWSTYKVSKFCISLFPFLIAPISHLPQRQVFSKTNNNWKAKWPQSSKKVQIIRLFCYLI